MMEFEFGKMPGEELIKSVMDVSNFNRCVSFIMKGTGQWFRGCCQ